MDMRVIEVNKYSDFLALEGIWKDALQRCDYHTVFSTWEWLTTWWKHFGNNRRLLVLLAEENGKIIGIAPMMYSVHRMLGLRQGKIEFISTPDGDYNDFILIERKEECLRLFFDHLNRFPENWNCMDLVDIPQSSECLPFLDNVSRSLGSVHNCPFVSLPRSYEDFLKSLSHNLRYDIRRNLRRLEREGYKVSCDSYSETRSFAEGIDAFFRLHQKRWKSKGYGGVFAEERMSRFHLDIAKTLSQKGWLGLFLLNLSENPVAALYGFKYRSKFYCYLSGLDPRYGRYSIGNLLLSFVIAHCIEEGLLEFDLLRGAEEYKDRWNTTPRWNQRALIPRKNFLGNCRNWLYEEYWRQGSRLKYILRIKR